MKFNANDDAVFLCYLVFKFILEVLQTGGFMLCPETTPLKGSDPLLYVFLLGHGLQQVYQRKNRKELVYDIIYSREKNRVKS